MVEKLLFGGDGKRKGRGLGIREGESKMQDSIFCVKRSEYKFQGVMFDHTNNECQISRMGGI